MLSLILLYFIGKKYYSLAEEYDKNMWGFAILGVSIYFVGAIVLGVIIMFFLELGGVYIIGNYSDTVVGLMMMPFGLLSCYLLYLFLEKKWVKEKPKKAEKIIDEIGRDSNF